MIKSFCILCSKSFRQDGVLKTHMLPTMQRPCALAHNVPSNSLELETWILPCPMSIHTDQKLYTCAQCAKPFSGARTLKMHLCIHIREKLHKCKHCISYLATQAGSVRRHPVMYSGKDYIVQNVKTFNFGWKSGSSHAYPHCWGESKCRCPQCTYSTTTKQALGFHSQTTTKRGIQQKEKKHLDPTFLLTVQRKGSTMWQVIQSSFKSEDSLCRSPWGETI